VNIMREHHHASLIMQTSAQAKLGEAFRHVPEALRHDHGNQHLRAVKARMNQEAGPH
jgi:hypothetical protein